MTGPDKRLARAEECRRLAGLALDLAAASSLDHVREKHEAAAQRWLALAEIDENPLLAGQKA